MSTINNTISFTGTIKEFAVMTDMTDLAANLFMNYLKKRGIAKEVSVKKAKGRGRPSIVYTLPTEFQLSLLDQPEATVTVEPEATVTEPEQEATVTEPEQEATVTEPEQEATVTEPVEPEATVIVEPVETLATAV